jgi:hypothetical protein
MAHSKNQAVSRRRTLANTRRRDVDVFHRAAAETPHARLTKGHAIRQTRSPRLPRSRALSSREP